MSHNRTGCRADVFEITDVLSKAMSRPVTAEADEPYTRLLPHQTERMGKTTALLQEVVWETYKGTYGPSTLLKKVEHTTIECPDCEVPAEHNSKGEIICPNDCGWIQDGPPAMVAEDQFQRTIGAASGANGYFISEKNEGKPAMNPTRANTDEPDVQ